MRIILLPLTRRQTLLYAQRLTENDSHKPSPWITWALSKAQTTWGEWGKSTTSWKAKTVATGNRLLDAIDWEEYSLKTVHDPKSTTTDKVRVVHPSWVKADELSDIISEIVRRRQPIHQTYRWRWAVAIPLSAPFSLVPVIPNLPFFYAAYRLWSHHKAFKGSVYLDQLIKSDALVSEPSKLLDEMYKFSTIPTLTRSDVQLGSSAEELLLHKDQLTEIATEFKDNEIAVLGNRALTQLTKQLDGEKKEVQAKEKESVKVTSVKVKPDSEEKDKGKR